MKNAIICCLFLALIAAAYGAQNDLKMYLCADSLSQKKAGVKMVYGYIQGKKTDCMSEYEFLAVYGQSVFIADSASRGGQGTDTGAGAQAGSDDIVRQIRAGKKDLDGADLMAANLAGADLSDAHLESADLRSANLSNANLAGANLKAAFLKKAVMRGANFKNAVCTGTYFLAADLRGAKNLTLEQLKTVRTLYAAQLDAEVLAVVKAEIPDKLKEPKKCWADNAWSDNEDCEPSKQKPEPR